MAYTPPAGNALDLIFVAYTPPAGNVLDFEMSDGGNADVFDTLNISESVTVSLSQLGNISVSDTLNISESITTSSTPLGGISVSDTLNISESIVNTGQLGGINCFDTLNISESESVVPFQATLTLSVSDIVNISQNVSITNSQLGGVNVSDSVNISDIGNINIGLADRLISTFDSLNISENFLPLLSIDGSTTFDNISISENIHLVLFLNVSKTDSISLSESVALESFRFSPSPGNSRPKGSIKALNPVAEAGKGSFDRPVGYSSGYKSTVGNKGLSM